MDGLAAFLAERLDEDEMAAKEAASNDDRARSWADAEGGYPVAGPVVVDGWGVAIVPLGARWGQVRHIARHDPARALREVEAGRKLLAAYDEAVNGPSADLGVADALEAVIRDRTAVWSDHPDYRAEWKP